MSNPNINFNGVPMGNPDSADAARYLNERREVYAAYREAPNVLPPTKPENLNANAENGSVLLTWLDSENETSYSI